MSSLIKCVLCSMLIVALALEVKAYSWESSVHGFPPNAVLAGYDEDNLPVFVARADHNGQFNVLGYASPSKQKSYVMLDDTTNTMHVKPEWEYLVGDCFYWTHAYDGNVPRYAVSDISDAKHAKVYVGRQYDRRGLTSGKIRPDLKVLFNPFSGREHGFDKYEVLVSCEHIF